MDIFSKIQSGSPVPMDLPEYQKVHEAAKHTIELTTELNKCGDLVEIRNWLGKIVGYDIDTSVTVFPPFHINYGGALQLGKNIFINHDCIILGLGKVIIEDDVMIGPRVTLTSENHPVGIKERKALIGKPITIKQNAWIGASVTILPGVTVGENAVIAAGAVVNKDVPPNTLVAGVPAKVMKTIDQ